VAYLAQGIITADVLVLMITVHDDDARIFEAMCAGACGYLLKKTPPEKLVESVREVVAGGAPMSPEVARRVVELFREFQPPARADYHLTPHELRVLAMLVDGHNYKTAAAELGVLAVHRVSFHMRRVYEAAGASKSEAVARALRDARPDTTERRTCRKVREEPENRDTE
jgi:DNA-binding NarL/FixJ family response regulator